MRTSRLRQSLCVFRMCCLSLASSLRISFSWGTQRLCTAQHRKRVVQDWLLAAATEARLVSSLFFVFASLSLSLSYLTLSSRRDCEKAAVVADVTRESLGISWFPSRSFLDLSLIVDEARVGRS